MHNPRASLVHACVRRMHAAEKVSRRSAAIYDMGMRDLSQPPYGHARPVSAANLQSRGNMVRTHALALGAPMHAFGQVLWPLALAAPCMHSGTSTRRASWRLHACICAHRYSPRGSRDDGEFDARLRLDELTPLGEILETVISDHLLPR